MKWIALSLAAAPALAAGPASAQDSKTTKRELARWTRVVKAAHIKAD
jgi:hypothetical protein